MDYTGPEVVPNFGEMYPQVGDTLSGAGILALRLEDEIKVRAKEKQIRKPKDSVTQKYAEQTHAETRKELAKLAGDLVPGPDVG
nr:hypothetical protein [uncultured Acetobacterium sp.]